MPQLRQLTINAEDPVLLAGFYQDVFQLEKIGEHGGAVFLSDGSFKLALLPLRDGRSRGFKWNGIRDGSGRID